MKVPAWSLTALLVVANTHQSVAQAILSPPLLSKRASGDEGPSNDDLLYERVLDRRVPQNQQQAPGTTSGSNSGSLQIGASPAEVNSTVANACSGKLASLTSVSNPAGFAGCYNVLDFDAATTRFQADLRIYTKSAPTGQFSGIARNDILVLLNFPSSTSFKTLTKRAEVQLEERQDAGSGAEFQQFSLSGSITTPLNIGKLSEIQLASLLTPQIKLQATSAGQTFSANMSTEDAAFFVTGQFTDLSSKAKQVADPNTATTAIAATKGFVLPGTTFGIFPVGLIVTSAWTILFVLAYGAGTIGRIHYRNIYRKRAAFMAGRSYNAPGIGKL